MGVSGGTGTNSRAGWRALNARLVSGDILVVVAIDRIGRRWMDTVNAVRDLRTREVRIRSLAQSEATWVTYLASEPDTAEAVSRRTKAGLERARAEGKTLGPPPRVDEDQVEDMSRLRREGQSFRSIGRIFGVSRTTVQRRLQDQGQDKSNAQAITRLGQTNATTSLRGWKYGISVEAIKQKSGRLLYRAYTNGGSNGHRNNDLLLEISTDADGQDRAITLYYKGELIDLDKVLTSVS